MHQFGLEPIILSVDKDYASYFIQDDSLEKEIHPKTLVYKTKSWEVLSVVSKLIGKKNVPVSGFANVDETKPLQKIMRFVRGNLFLPDARKGWNKYALREAGNIIKQHSPEIIITTGAPQSTHLIGQALKKKYGIPWVCDFRDLWTEIYYNDLLYRTKLTIWYDRRLERKALEDCDGIVAVGPGILKLIADKVNKSNRQVVFNGYDDKDFPLDSNPKSPRESKIIRYTGTLTAQYNLDSIFTVLKGIKQRIPEVKVEFYGTLSEHVKVIAEPLDFVQLFPSVSHNEVVQLQTSSDLLLLLNPETKSMDEIIPGKVYEYMKTGKPVLGIGSSTSDANWLLEGSGLGHVFDYSQHQEMIDFSVSALRQTPEENREFIEQFSRENQTKNLVDFLRSTLS